MKSRFSIEVDFDNGNEPVLQIVSRDSEDVRDALIKAFYQKLQGSSWCKIRFAQDYQDHANPENDFKRIQITPISEKDLKKEADVMLEQFRLRQEFEKKQKK